MKERSLIKSGKIMYIYNVMKKYTDVEHPVKIAEIIELVKNEYGEEISDSTVKRDLKVLEEKLNVIIGKIDHKYYIEKDDNELEVSEIRCLVDMINYSRFIEEKQAKQLTYKLIKQLNTYEQEEFVGYKKYMKDAKTINKDVFLNIEIITEAIQNKKYIKFGYYKYNLKKETELIRTFDVSPITIICEIGEYYLIGIDADRILKYFRLDRMKDAEIKEGKFVNITKKELDDFVQSSVGMYAGKKEKVQAICDNSLIDDAIESFGKDVKITQYDKDRFKMETEVSLRGFKNWALRHLSDAEVIYPEKLKNEIYELLKSKLKNK